MRTCSGIRADGGRCKAQPMRGSEYCLNHDPSRAEENRRRSSNGGRRGGRGRPQVEVANIKTQLQDLVDGVLEGEINRADASVCGQLLNYKLKALALDMQVKEQLEYGGRFEAMQEVLTKRKDRPYGA